MTSSFSVTRLTALGVSGPPRPYRLLSGRSIILASLLLVATPLVVPVAAATPDPIRLTLAQSRELALQHNLNLAAQREALAAAGYLARAEEGAFEPEFVAQLEKSRTERQNTVEQVLSQGASVFLEDARSASAAVEGIWRLSGARYRLGYNLRETANNLRLQPFDPFREEYQNFLGLTVEQPLLQGRGPAATSARLRVARGEEEIAFQEYRRQLMQVIHQVEVAYWDLYYAKQNLRLRLASRDQAEQLLADNRERVEVGMMSDLEVLQARAGVSLRASQISQAEQLLVEASNRLRTLLADAAGSGRLLEAADSPGEWTAPEDFHALMDTALDAQPAYLAGLRRLEQEGIKVGYARNQRLPRVDLKGSYGYSGLDDNTRDAFRRIERGSFRSWSVGVEVRVPILRNVRRSNDLFAAEAGEREAEVRLRMLEIEIGNVVHSAWQKVLNLQRVQENLAVVVDFNRQLLETEQVRIEEGRSDSRRLLEVEGEMTDARIAHLESIVAHRRAVVELELVTGSLLARRNLEVDRAKDVF
ncbi:MAG: TolC family protein [Puniceicoccaceae bacterium]|nr:MAG: TolC family protein [Puniceicoccaceae bacterium]